MIPTPRMDASAALYVGERGSNWRDLYEEGQKIEREFTAFKQQAREWIEDAHQEGFEAGVMIECFKSSEIHKVWNEAYNESKAAGRREAV